MLPVNSSHSHSHSLRHFIAGDIATEDEINYIGRELTGDISSDDKGIRLENCFSLIGNKKIEIKTTKHRININKGEINANVQSEGGMITIDQAKVAIVVNHKNGSIVLQNEANADEIRAFGCEVLLESSHVVQKLQAANAGHFSIGETKKLQWANEFLDESSLNAHYNNIILKDKSSAKIILGENVNIKLENSKIETCIASRNGTIVMTDNSSVDDIDASCESVRVDNSVVTNYIFSHTVECPVALVNSSKASEIQSERGAVTLAGGSMAELITTESVNAKVSLSEKSKANYIETSRAPVSLDNCQGIIDIETQGTGGDVILSNNSSADTISTINSAVNITNSRVLDKISTQGIGGNVTLLNNAFTKDIHTSGGAIKMQHSRAESLNITNGRLNLQDCRIYNSIIHKGAKPFFLSAVTATGKVSTECTHPILGKNSKISFMNWTPQDAKTSGKILSEITSKAVKSPSSTNSDIKPTVYQLTVSGTIDKLTTDYTGNAELRVVLKGESKINGTLDPRFTLQRDN